MLGQDPLFGEKPHMAGNLSIANTKTVGWAMAQPGRYPSNVFLGVSLNIIRNLDLYGLTPSVLMSFTLRNWWKGPFTSASSLVNIQQTRFVALDAILATAHFGACD